MLPPVLLHLSLFRFLFDLLLDVIRRSSNADEDGISAQLFNHTQGMTFSGVFPSD